jgi:hypothetical protein
MTIAPVPQNTSAKVPIISEIKRFDMPQRYYRNCNVFYAFLNKES